ncbi:hypothetical protein EUGRSUZ_E00447 [Eucalyptus grandis]|uniref:Uncharacterized protein n=2 Tax=Eucalyptus grandis TaxID=71139 RepID=A0ACC3KU12_EUCGR|nr:hypothetical protein EUGRSUZ_E00447 [Eucalyptus grandis]
MVRPLRTKINEKGILAVIEGSQYSRQDQRKQPLVMSSAARLRWREKLVENTAKRNPSARSEPFRRSTASSL